MDAFQIALIAVLSPILLAAGILHLISTANLSVTAIACNGLAVTLAGLRFAWDPPGARGILMTLFILFLALALTANARLCLRFRAARSRRPPPVPAPAPARASEGRRVPPPPSRPRPASKPKDPQGVKVLSPTTWILHNLWGDVRLYAVPPSIAEQNPGMPTSDRRFRILYDEEEAPIEGVFTVSSSLQILLPPEHLNRLKDRDMIRFEIVG